MRSTFRAAPFPNRRGRQKIVAVQYAFVLRKGGRFEMSVEEREETVGISDETPGIAPFDHTSARQAQAMKDSDPCMLMRCKPSTRTKNSLTPAVQFVFFWFCGELVVRWLFIKFRHLNVGRSGNTAPRPVFHSTHPVSFPSPS